MGEIIRKAHTRRNSKTGKVSMVKQSRPFSKKISRTTMGEDGKWGSLEISKNKQRRLGLIEQMSTIDPRFRLLYGGSMDASDSDSTVKAQRMRRKAYQKALSENPRSVHGRINSGTLKKAIGLSMSVSKAKKDIEKSDSVAPGSRGGKSYVEGVKRAKRRVRNNGLGGMYGSQR